VQNGYLDQVPVERVKDFQNQLTDFVTARKAPLLAKISKEKALAEPLKAELKDALDEFQEQWKALPPR